MIDPVWRSVELLNYVIGKLCDSDLGLRGTDPSGTGAGRDPARCSNPTRAAHAYERIALHKRKMEACDRDTRHILLLAFDPDPPVGLRIFAEPVKGASPPVPRFGPRAVLCCPVARERYVASHSPRPLLEWLRHRAQAATAGKGDDKARARKDVEVIRAATAVMVTRAVEVYGGADKAEPTVDTESFTVRGLVKASGISAEAVLNRLTRSNVPRQKVRGRGGIQHRILRHDLDSYCPELARMVAR